MSRQQDVLDARSAADEWASEQRLRPSGGYSGPWYRDAYLGGWWPQGWVRWWADYSKPAGFILGDDVVGHQYTSTPVDTSEFVESEVLPLANCDEYRAALERGVNRLSEVLAKKTALSKKLVREIANEMFNALQGV